MKKLIVMLMLGIAVGMQAQAAVALRVTDGVRQQEVVLADQYISVTDGAVRTVYDFQARRRIVIDVASRTYVDYSLFDTVYARALARSEEEQSDAVVDERGVDDQREFASGGVKLLAWSTRGVKVAAADAARFAQFLLHTQGGHPRLLARLGGEGVIPECVALYLPDRTVRLSITAPKPAPPGAYDLQGYAPRAAQQGLDAVLDRIAAATPAQLAAWHAEHRCEAGSGTADFLLAEAECMAMTGAEPRYKTDRALQATLAQDATAQLFYTVVGGGGRARHAQALTGLDQLRALAPRRGTVLKMFEAGHRDKLGQGAASLQLMTEALQENPLLAPAYGQLGDLLRKQRDIPRAWRCWEGSRRIWAESPAGRELTRREAQLIEDYPEYF